MEEFKKLLASDVEVDSIERHFDSIANYLMNKLCIQVGVKSYRIIELEFYYCDKTDFHSDPYIHGYDEQLENGMWYFNGFGLDLTFGKKDKNILGGILIRGIRSIEEMPKYFSGPSILLKELFTAMGSAFSSLNGIQLEKVSEKILEERLLKGKRIGLVKKEKDKSNYLEKPYRYIIEHNYSHKYKNKEKVFNDNRLEDK